MTAYFAHGATLALAWFFLVNLAACGVAAVTAALCRRHDRSSGFWFRLRVFPATASLVFVAGMFLPSYLQYEPRETGEGFDVTLTVLAAGAAALLVAAAIRGAAAWVSATRRSRAWMSSARRFGVHNGVPTFQIDADTPMMALVGIVRPRLIVTTPLVGALSSDEMQASIAHEVAHWRAWDNLKRLAMRAAPDLLGTTGAGRAIERRWASAAEHAADNYAGGTNPATRCALASALVKIVRLMPQPTPAAEPISTLIGGGDIASRVSRLLEDAPMVGRAAKRTPRWTAAAVVALAVAASYPTSLVTVHDVTEALVHFLP